MSGHTAEEVFVNLFSVSFWDEPATGVSVAHSSCKGNWKILHGGGFLTITERSLMLSVDAFLLG